MEDEHEVLARAGTDGSYDLVVEVIRPRPEGTVVVRGEGGATARRIAEVERAVAAEFGGLCDERNVGLRLCLFQRLPDPFVITARVKAALHTSTP